MPLKQKHNRRAKTPCNFLVASPFAASTPYQRCVVLLIRSDSRGAMGVLLDAAFRESIREFKEQMHEDVIPVERGVRLNVVNWSTAELLDELQRGVWLTTPARHEDLAGAEDLWVSLVRRIGRSVLTSSLAIDEFPANPMLN